MWHSGSIVWGVLMHANDAWAGQNRSWDREASSDVMAVWGVTTARRGVKGWDGEVILSHRRTEGGGDMLGQPNVVDCVEGEHRFSQPFRRRPRYHAENVIKCITFSYFEVSGRFFVDIFCGEIDLIFFNRRGGTTAGWHTTRPWQSYSI